MKRAVLLWMALLIFIPMLDSWSVETGITQSKTVTTGASEANPSEEVPVQDRRFTRSQWGLNESEWHRYLTLMQGIRGSISQPNLSPLEALGIHAQTDEERREYAGRLAKMMHEDTERVLAFARVYQEEAGKLNPNSALIDSALLGLGKTPPKKSLHVNDRLLFFTRMNGCPLCDSQLASLVSTAGRQLFQLDIYVMDAKTDADIRTWGKHKALDPESLKHQTFTLNHDRGTQARLPGATGSVPKTLLLRDQSLTAIDPVSLN